MDSYDVVRKNMKRLLNFQKKSFNYVFNTMIMIQEQFEIMTFYDELALKKSGRFRSDAFQFQKNGDYFKNLVDGGFEKAESLSHPPDYLIEYFPEPGNPYS